MLIPKLRYLERYRNMAKEKLIQAIYLTHEVRIIKRNDKYFVETSTEHGDTSATIAFSQLSTISRQLALMVFEHFNPDHHDIKPCGFTK